MDLIMNKIIKKILYLLFAFMTGCSVFSNIKNGYNIHSIEENIERTIKPITVKTKKDEKINIAVPIYRF